MSYRLDPVLAANDDLLGERPTSDYTEAERRFGAEVRARLDDLLQGRRTQVLVLRRYHGERDRVAIMPVAKHIDRSELRLPIVEHILVSTLTSMRAASPGGPVVQESHNGSILETQQFSTRHPHIVIERRDAFPRGNGGTPGHTEWILRRIQNQHAAMRTNRVLDASNLVLNLFDLVVRRL